jgi:hypothetical protein
VKRLIVFELSSVIYVATQVVAACHSCGGLSSTWTAVRRRREGHFLRTPGARGRRRGRGAFPVSQFKWGEPYSSWYYSTPSPYAMQGQGQFFGGGYPAASAAGPSAAGDRRRRAEASAEGDAANPSKRADSRASPPPEVAALRERLSRMEELMAKMLPNSGWK